MKKSKFIDYGVLLAALSGRIANQEKSSTGELTGELSSGTPSKKEMDN